MTVTPADEGQNAGAADENNNKEKNSKSHNVLHCFTILTCTFQKGTYYAAQYQPG